MNLGLQLAAFLWILYGPLSETAKVVCLVIAIVAMLGGFAYGPRWPLVFWSRRPPPP